MIRQFAIDINVLENREALTEQMIYVATALNFNIINATCPNCGSRATQKPHSSYTRWLLIWEDGKKIEKRVDVTRTICGACEGTHAIVPDTVIPHMQYSLLFVLGVMWEYTNRQRINKTVASICAEREISPTTLYNWNARFRMHIVIDLGAVATADEISARYWPPQGDAINSGITKDFFIRHMFSLMQYAKAATQSAAEKKRVAAAGADSHKIGIEYREAVSYPVHASKNTWEAGLNYGKGTGSIPNGTIQVRADCADGAENVPGHDGGGVLQEGDGAAVGATGWRDEGIRPEDFNEMGGALHGGGVRRVDQAAAQGQRRHACPGRGRGGKNMRHKRAVPETAGDTS